MTAVLMIGGALEHRFWFLAKQRGDADTAIAEYEQSFAELEADLARAQQGGAG